MSHWGPQGLDQPDEAQLAFQGRWGKLDPKGFLPVLS